MFHEVM